MSRKKTRPRAPKNPAVKATRRRPARATGQAPAAAIVDPRAPTSAAAPDSTSDDAPAADTASPSRSPQPRIVGLGASAGGLAALEQFFRNVKPDTGVAWVVVQHLDPEHASVLVELLQRVTAIPVSEVVDGVPLMVDNVYVIPPNREMEVIDSLLLLTMPTAPRGRRMAIDVFFRSLADERGADAVAVVLSGTGSDGALGLKAIHQAGGLCLVQDRASARFDGMPAAARAAVGSSLVGPAEALPAILVKALGQAGTRPRPATGTSEVGLLRVLTVLRSATGRDFTQYKRRSVLRRIERRMAANGLSDVEAYARFLREQPAEMKTLLQELLINVTRFFRDPEAFAALQAGVLASLIDGKAEGEPLRVWVGGCASGEEAYSIAILLRELVEKAPRKVKVQIYSTDLDDEAIAMARAGIYPASIAADVPPERLRRFFVREDAGYRICKEIREQVVFAVQDLIKDPPFTGLDLVSCRNVFIYLEPELQHRILTLFHYALRPGGTLFLSPAEGVGEQSSLFTPIDRKWRLFRAQRSGASARAMLTSGLTWFRTPAGGERPQKAPQLDFAELARRQLLQHFAPASVLVDSNGGILYVHGETGHFLRPAPGHPTLDVVEMAREGLQGPIREALQRARIKGEPVHRTGVKVTRQGRPQQVDLTVRPVAAAKAPPGLLLLTFQEPAQSAKAGPAKRAARLPVQPRLAESARVQALTRELAYSRESLQATIEEQQTSQEELQSTNEEAQASNEELETAKEELQSVNEELTTVNAELQAKVEQLTWIQDDMKNLFDATNVGTVFLDEALCIKRFTREAARIYRLGPADTGRPLADIKSNLVDQDLLAEARAVLDDLVPVERQVKSLDGAWYLARLLPYRTTENAIRGVVMTFTDISERIAAEALARLERELAERIVEATREPLLVLDGGLRVVSANGAFHATFATRPETTVGRHVYELADRRWDLPSLRQLLEQVLPRDQAFEGFAVNETSPDGTVTRRLMDGRRIGGGDGSTALILLAFRH